MIQLKIDLPDREVGVKIEIDGLGVFENGTTAEVSEEDLVSFVVHHAQYDHRYDKKGNLHTTIRKKDPEKLLPEGATIGTPVAGNSQKPGGTDKKEGEQ